MYTLFALLYPVNVKCLTGYGVELKQPVHQVLLRLSPSVGNEAAGRRGAAPLFAATSFHKAFATNSFY